MDPHKSITWSALEHRHTARGVDWFWALGIVVISCALIALIFSNILFSLLIIVAGITLGIVAAQPPATVTFEIHERGVQAGESFHSFKELNAFWIVREDDEWLLLLDSQRFMAPHIIIPLEGTDPEEVRALLLEHELPEVELHEPLSVRILDFFGF